MPKKVTKENSFEEAIEELENITKELDAGSMSLDDSIQAYERGVQLKKKCLDILSKAEKRLEYIEKHENGTLERVALEEPMQSSQSHLFSSGD